MLPIKFPFELFQLAESLVEGSLEFGDLLFELFQALESFSFLRSLFLCPVAKSPKLLGEFSDGARVLLVAEFAPELCGQANRLPISSRFLTFRFVPQPGHRIENGRLMVLSVTGKQRLPYQPCIERSWVLATPIDHFRSRAASN